MEYRMPLRIVIVNPPEGVNFCLTDDKDNLVSVTLFPESISELIPLAGVILIRM